MKPGLSARLFRARLLVVRAIRRAFGGFDASDVFTILGLVALGIGIAMLSVPAALIVSGSLLLAVTPIGAAVRMMLRGR
jgi:hypothetical protein